MSRRRLGCFLLAAVICGGAVFVGVELQAMGRRITSEYLTAEVIRDVTEYVRVHRGKWPKRWDDLPHDPRSPQLVRLDFNADVEELMDDPARIHAAIVPVTGRYQTYPYADRQLDELRELLIQIHRPPGPPLPEKGRFTTRGGRCQRP